MIIRRYYNRNISYPYYFHPEIKTYHKLVEYADSNPEAPVFDYDNAEYEMMLSHEEQNNRWKETVGMVMRDTRWVLDNLDDLQTYIVRWSKHEQKDPRYKNGIRSLGVGKPPENITKYCDKIYNWIAIK